MNQSPNHIPCCDIGVESDEILDHLFRCDLKPAQESIDDYYYGCIAGMSAMMHAFIQPSKVTQECVHLYQLTLGVS